VKLSIRLSLWTASCIDGVSAFGSSLSVGIGQSTRHLESNDDHGESDYGNQRLHNRGRDLGASDVLGLMS
jgi:hypothetical protein